MKETKKLTMSAISVALSVVFMALGAFIEVLDLTSAALSSIVMLFVFIEIRKPYTYLVWLASSLLGFAFFPQSFVWVTYFLVFGIYPILKAYIEKLKRPFWLPVKLLYFNVASPLMILASEYLLGIPFFSDDLSIPFLEENTFILKIVIYVLLNVALIVYDYFLTVMVRFYFSTFRKRIEKILK